jgi:hypothetical protein
VAGVTRSTCRCCWEPGHRGPGPGPVRRVLRAPGVGEVFALGYAATFALLGRAAWWLGGLLGLLHAAIALTVLVPLLPGSIPRIASNRAGPASTAALEPPGCSASTTAPDPAGDRDRARGVYGTALGLLLEAS